MSKPFIPKRFLGAFKAGHRYSSREFIDESLSYELLKKVLESKWKDLNAIETLDYLTKFNNEYHKAVIKKGDQKAFHNTDQLRKERYSANNHRNNDILSAYRYCVDSLTAVFVETESGPKMRGVVAAASRTKDIDQEEILVDLMGASRKFGMN